MLRHNNNCLPATYQIKNKDKIKQRKQTKADVECNLGGNKVEFNAEDSAGGVVDIDAHHHHRQNRGDNQVESIVGKRAHHPARRAEGERGQHGEGKLSDR